MSTRLGFTDLILANNDRPFGADQFYGNYGSWERTRTWFAGLRQALGKRTEVSFAYRRHSDLFVLFRDNPQYFTNRHITDGYQAAVRREDPVAANVRIHYGLEAYRDSIDSNNLGHHDRDRAAGYSLSMRGPQSGSRSPRAREKRFTVATKPNSARRSALGIGLHPGSSCARTRVTLSACRAIPICTITIRRTSAPQI